MPFLIPNRSPPTLLIVSGTPNMMWWLNGYHPRWSESNGLSNLSNNPFPSPYKCPLYAFVLDPFISGCLWGIFHVIGGSYIGRRVSIQWYRLWWLLRGCLCHLIGGQCDPRCAHVKPWTCCLFDQVCNLLSFCARYYYFFLKFMQLVILNVISIFQPIASNCFNGIINPKL
jgi:hypothetical protein